MKKQFLALCLVLLPAAALTAQTYRVVSPDGKVKVEVSADNQLRYAVQYEQTTVIRSSELAMSLSDGTVWGVTPKIAKSVRQSVDETIPSPFYKRAAVADRYHLLRLETKQGYAVEFRVYDDGMAYRFVSLSGGPLTVLSERVEYRFEEDFPVYAAYTNSRNRSTIDAQFFNSFENTYVHEPITKLLPERLVLLPAVVELHGGLKVCLSEAGLEDYPGLYLIRGRQGTQLDGVQPRYPNQFVTGGHNMLQQIVTGTTDYLARTEGKRTFPWRMMIIAEQDKQLTGSDMVYRLGAPNRIGDTSWIKPGKVAWEWWNDWGIHGVDFETGVNTQTYQYYIDFASRHGIEYVILDEGWSVPLEGDLYKIVPEVDLPEIIRYGKSKNVDIILWAGYGALIKDVEGLCRHYAEMGVKGFKVDFMDRNDQPMVNDIDRIARICAQNKLLVDFHGMYQPGGMNRTYPHVLNFEGVHGLEQMKWEEPGVDQVTYDVTIPFIRMVAGPMDYTQGAMRNVTEKGYYPSWTEPMSQGTRARQLAQYVIFESPLSMLCDSPVNYEREPVCTEYIVNMPVVWDETIPLDGKIAEYVAMARRSGEVWYVGAMTNWTERTITLDLSEFADGAYEVTLYKDGVNAAKYAVDFALERFRLPDNKKITLRMAPGGGAAAILRPVK